MSTHFIRLIPTEPTYVPSPEARAQARVLLQTFAPEAQDVEAILYDTVSFVDQGENFESVRCPGCGQELDDAWWGTAMDAAYENQFRCLAVSTPCCAYRTSLNDLNYHWPAGFSRFVLEARAPHIAELETEQIRRSEQVLGCRLRQIWACY